VYLLKVKYTALMIENLAPAKSTTPIHPRNEGERSIKLEKLKPDQSDHYYEC
jgi:hypothetical protein